MHGEKNEISPNIVNITFWENTIVNDKDKNALLCWRYSKEDIIGWNTSRDAIKAYNNNVIAHSIINMSKELWILDSKGESNLTSLDLTLSTN